ncbi:hypothetical protein [Amycolatopsis sp. La24]|uniref:hypothetical protein n=1 Tax=Amycolatopsis sp. La24 TaxID=3028304 RepID=UPI0023B19C51|nr:hypothetical protein [Amycolatopsis sp. La24]
MNAPDPFDPENQFLGSVLWSDLPGARALMAGMRPDDFARPMAAHVAHLAMQVMADNQAPGPALLFDQAVRTGQASGEHRATWLSRELADLYGNAAGAVHGPRFKAAVLEHAYRRAAARYARRLLQAADQADPAGIAARLDERGELDALAARYRAAAGPDALDPPDIVRPAGPQPGPARRKAA